MKKSSPAVFLGISVILFILSIILAVIGSRITGFYSQMKESPVVTSVDELKNYVSEGFLLTGILQESHVVKLNGGEITLLEGFEYSEPDVSGIRDGATITIYGVNSIKKGYVKGYKLYEGNPKQYLQSLSTPLDSYLVFVYILISLGVIFFVASIVLNNKK